MNEKAMIEPQGMQEPEKPLVGPDREVWVRNQVFTAMRMALALSTQIDTEADRTAQAHALQGIANGAAIEIFRTLGFSLEFVNLPKPVVPAIYKLSL